MPAIVVHISPARTTQIECHRASATPKITLVESTGANLVRIGARHRGVELIETPMRLSSLKQKQRESLRSPAEFT